MKYLLDTMVVSEPGKTRANPDVVRWLRGIDPLDAAISSLTLGEIEAGIVRLSDPRRRGSLQTWLEHDVLRYFRNRVLPFDTAAARAWAEMRRRKFDTLKVVDSLIAATASSRDLTLITRNEADFAGLGLRLINPWNA
jgi:predicted nucleic acid-binding protein